jgi:hypothetical protein
VISSEPVTLLYFAVCLLYVRTRVIPADRIPRIYLRGGTRRPTLDVVDASESLHGYSIGAHSLGGYALEHISPCT